MLSPLIHRSWRSVSGKLAAAILVAALSAPGAALAQEPAEPRGKPLDQYLRDQLGDSELQGAIRDLLQSMQPVAKELEKMMRDLPQYEPPEMLPNGDIIIRRKRGENEFET